MVSNASFVYCSTCLEYEEETDAIVD